jgi:DNA polymerase
VGELNLKSGGQSRSLSVTSADDLIPIKLSLAALCTAAAGCQACDLWKSATQTVFGEGSPKSAIILVGEQPGDKEDLAGRPFVGPAGKILDEALRLAGIDRNEVYITNVVKHFKWSPDERGKRRIHKKPRSSEIQACRPWLDAEIRLVKPRILVCLGATAAQALLGNNFSVTRQRGQWVESSLAPKVMGTVHPSSILRARDSESRSSQMQAFVRDLDTVARSLNMKPAGRTENGVRQRVGQIAVRKTENSRYG